MKAFMQNTLLVFASILISVCLIEAGFRLSEFTYPSWQIRDSDVGFIGVPNAKGWWNLEGRAYVKYNSHGEKTSFV